MVSQNKVRSARKDDLSPKRSPHLLRVLKLRLLSKVSINAHRGGRVGVAEVALRSEDIHTGAVEDRGVVMPEVMRGEDRAGSVVFDAARGVEKRRLQKPPSAHKSGLRPEFSCSLRADDVAVADLAVLLE